MRLKLDWAGRDTSSHLPLLVAGHLCSPSHWKVFGRLAGPKAATHLLPSFSTQTRRRTYIFYTYIYIYVFVCWPPVRLKCRRQPNLGFQRGGIEAVCLRVDMVRPNSSSGVFRVFVLLGFLRFSCLPGNCLQRVLVSAVRKIDDGSKCPN